MQDPEDCANRGEMMSLDSNSYGIYYQDYGFISDREYYRTDCNSVGYNHIIMERDKSKSLYDLYTVTNGNDVDWLKNIYAWEEIGDGSVMIGSCLQGDEWVLFIADLNDSNIWVAKDDRHAQKVTMDDPINFSYLENYTEEVGNSDELYVIVKNNDTYSVVEAMSGNIICLNNKLKYPEEVESFNELVPFYNEEEDIYYLENEDGLKYDAQDGTILNKSSFNHQGNERLKIIKDYGLYKIVSIEPQYGYLGADEIPINIWYNGRWVLEQGKYHVKDLLYKNCFSHQFSHYILYYNRMSAKYNLIDLETGKFAFPFDLKNYYFKQNEGWGYGSGYNVNGLYKCFYFDNNGKMLFPDMLQCQSPSNDSNIHVVVFKNKPTYAYIISTHDYPTLINKDRPFDIAHRLKLKADGISGIDTNGIKIFVNKDGVTEDNANLHKEEFLDDLRNC